MSKCLITSGCSFSDPTSMYTTWPVHLTNVLGDNYQPIHLAMSTQGNGIISRKLIHKVNELLKEKSADELLVGIMWSGISRHDFYNETNPTYHPSKLAREDARWIDNPTGFVNEEKHWVIFNHHWDNVPNCRLYYESFQDSVGSQINTIEHILRTQWFLEKHNVKYFMSTYTNEVLSTKFINHPEVKYLYDQINFDTFLPSGGQFEWCKDYTNIELPENLHPNAEQNKKFTDEIILPFLKEKEYI